MESPSELSQLVRAAIAFFSVLGGFMAASSGWRAASSVTADERPGTTTAAINEGLADGFVIGIPCALFALIIETGIP